MSINSALWDALHDVAVTEIAAFANASVNCDVVRTTRIALPGETAPRIGVTAFPILATSALGSFLPKVVNDEADARQACARVWHCYSVHLFSIPSFTSLLATYYGLTENSLANTDAASGAPLAPEVLGNGHVPIVTHLFNRTAGHTCQTTVVDAVFLYTTYLRERNPVLVAAGVLLDVTSYGLSATATDAEVAAATPLLELAYQTSWHRFHLWPSATCPLTPILRDPAAGCLASRCPMFTVCPAGYRVQSTALNTCFPSIDDTGVEHVITDPPTSLSLATGEVTFWENTTFSLFDTVVTKQVGGIQPCGFSMGLGVCSHYTPATGVSTTPMCACAASAVAGDYGCQFDAAYCPFNATTGTCNGRGTCAFTRPPIRWTVPDLRNGFSNAMGCQCTLPWTGQTCAQSMCANANGDCHAAGTGTCTPVAGSWGCVCKAPRYGDACQFVDFARTDEEVAQLEVSTTSGIRLSTLLGSLHCYTKTSLIQQPPPTDEPLLQCSGRGVCVPGPGNASAPRCACNTGWTGPSCEYAACDHAATCGPFGRCILSVDAAGAARTSCVCAVHESNPYLVLATKSAATGSDTDTLLRCDISLCDQGSLVITGAPISPADFKTQLVGRCDCFSATFSLDAGLLNSTTSQYTFDGTVFTLHWPRHEFLPTLVEPNVTAGIAKPFAFIPVVEVANTGALCDVATCPRLQQPWNNQPVPGAQPCGADPTSAPQLCLKCDDHPLLGLCAFTSGFGGVCDCTGATTATAGTPYYLASPTAQRWTNSEDARNPMCEPYCKNGGTWSSTSQACLCARTGFTGETCDVPVCTHGTWTPDAPTTSTCSVCDMGWDLSTDCTSCAVGYTGEDCTSCATGYFRSQVTGECTSCSAAATGVCTYPGSFAARCTPTGPVCICNPGYTRPDAGCTHCAQGYTTVRQAFTGAVTCETCVTAGRCNPTFTVGATCSPNSTAVTCTCAIAGMDARCNTCVGGGVVNAAGTACQPCTQYLGCASPGIATRYATCSRNTLSLNTCVCAEGYSGTRCTTCAPGWIRALDGITCTRCTNATTSQATCGPWGALDCGSGTCACKNGRSGPTCTACTGCGVGGTCNTDTTPGSPWCVCTPGFSKASAANTAPCSTCANATLVARNGRCVSVAQACGTGTGVDVEATRHNTTGPCMCFPGFVGARCEACAPGHAGPGCMPCVGDANGATTECTWNPVSGTTKWACIHPFTGPTCTECKPGFVGPQCVPCPDCGLGGTCAMGTDDYENVPVCTCAPGFTHDSATAACEVCDPAFSPVSCTPCEPCGVGRVCQEPTADTLPFGACACTPGTRILLGVNDGPLVTCFSEARATTLEAACRGDTALLTLLSTTQANVTTPVDATDFLPTKTFSTSSAVFIVCIAFVAVTVLVTIAIKRGRLP